MHRWQEQIAPSTQKEDNLTLDNEDLGQAFFERLTECSGTRLIDFTDLTNNSFHVVTELTYKNGNDEFRPDISLRQRFGIEERNSATASRIIKETLEACLVRQYDEAASRKFMRYVPCWA